jgi:hypothetical protein
MRRLLQRFAEREHKLIGDTAWGSAETFELAPGFDISFGDAVALGDYFEDFDAIKRIAEVPGKGVGTQGELRYVLWVDIWDRPTKDKMGVWYDRYAVFHRQQLNKFYDQRNIGHFPNPVEGDTERSRLDVDIRRTKDGGAPAGAGAVYRRIHQEALTKAYEAGRAGKKPDEAMLTDGFACHFLTDAFSAGHAKTARKTVKEYWNGKVPNFDKKMIRWLADEIEGGKWAWYERAGAYIVEGQSIHGTALQNLTTKMAGNGFGDMLSLMLHDLSGAHGVKATSGGKAITLVGDSRMLDKQGAVKPEAQGVFDASTEAVKASIIEVQDAYIAAATKGTDPTTFRTKLQGADGLYAGERLMPVVQGGPEVRLNFDSVDALLADGAVNAALVEWGRIRGPRFANQIKDFNPKARDVVKRVLIDPLTSGDEDQVRGVLRKIIDYKI